MKKNGETEAEEIQQQSPGETDTRHKARRTAELCCGCSGTTIWERFGKLYRLRKLLNTTL